MTEESSAKAVRAHFEADAEYWSEVYDSTDDVAGLVYGERLQAALRRVDELGLAPGTAVADVGAGAGLAATALAARGFAVTAFDSADRMIELTRDRAAQEGLTIGVVRAEAQALPVADDAFELVVALGLLPWLDEPAAALREFRRVLAPGGSIVVTTDNRWRLVELLDPTLSALTTPLRRNLAPRLRAIRGRETAPFEVQRHSTHDLKRLLGAAGFVNIATTTVGYGPITFMRKPLLHGATGMRVAKSLSRHGTKLPLLRSMGVHVVARASAPQIS